MNAVLYHSHDYKKINGTLFYCFEYFVFLKQFLPDIKYVLMNTDETDLELFLSVFRDKYVFDESFLDDIIPLKKYTDFIRLGVSNIMTLDVKTYTIMSPFMGKACSVSAYSNDIHGFVGKKPHHTFYGYYDYQPCDIKTRLKLYKDIHRLYGDRGDKIFVSTPSIGNNIVLGKLGLKKEDVYFKTGNTHHTNLFKNIGSIIYYHTGHDRNNRVVVEAYIHDIPITIHYNGYDNDSVKERHDLICHGDPKVLFLSDDDVMIRNFINDCKN